MLDSAEFELKENEIDMRRDLTLDEIVEFVSIVNSVKGINKAKLVQHNVSSMINVNYNNGLNYSLEIKKGKLEIKPYKGTRVQKEIVEKFRYHADQFLDRLQYRDIKQNKTRLRTDY